MKRRQRQRKKKERLAFQQAHGMSPEDFLAKFRSDALPKTGENYRIMYLACLLENR